MIKARLVGTPEAKARREALGELLRIGYVNGKQLKKRLQMFQINQETFWNAIQQIDQEESERR